jgi:hypothetical protein
MKLQAVNPTAILRAGNLTGTGHVPIFAATVYGGLHYG